MSEQFSQFLRCFQYINVLFWPSHINYQLVPPHTDSVPLSTNHCCPLLTHYTVWSPRIVEPVGLCCIYEKCKRALAFLFLEMTTAAAPLIFKSPLSNNEPAALNIFYLLNPPQLSLSNSIAHFKGKCLKQRYWGHKFRQRNSPVFIQIGAGRFSYLLQRRE